jgi:hypothetical protein
MAFLQTTQTLRQGKLSCFHKRHSFFFLDALPIRVLGMDFEPFVGVGPGADGIKVGIGPCFLTLLFRQLKD